LIKNPNIAIIDCQTTGISGDKFLGALIDLGIDIKKIEDALSIIPNHMENVSSIKLSTDVKSFNSFKATKVELRFIEKKIHRHGMELIEITQNCLTDLKMSEQANEFALSIIKNLINIEAKVHNSTPKEIHLHETGSVDTLIDSIGSAFAMDSLNLFKNVKWLCLPIAVGSGSFKFSHGLVSAPAPATLAIISANNIEIIGGPVSEELTTPTGAAILASLKIKSISSFPNMKIKSIGYGVGTKKFPGIPNILRIILGHQVEIYSNTDEVIILETNLDDVTGEIIGYTINKLLLEGLARDVCAIPTITKKNRPGHILKVITDSENENNIVRILMEETGTLGIRKIKSKRYILDREEKEIELEVNNKKWKVMIKIVKNQKGKIIRIKPEFEDISNIAKKTSLPARLIEKIVNNKIQNLFF